MLNGEGFSFDQMVAFIESAPANIFFKDTSCCYRVVSEVCSLINGGRDSSIIGKTDVEIWADKTVGRRYYEDDLRIIETGEGSEWIDEFPAPDGSLYFLIQKNPVYCDGKLMGIVGLVSDVTKQKRLELELERLSTTDQLTGLYNRNFLELKFEESYPQDRYPIGLIVLDCNNLKIINDVRGHKYGDLMLRRIAAEIKEAIPDDAVAARLGGDEFLIACLRTSEEEVSGLAAKLKKRFELASDDEVSLDAAMGFAIAGDADASLHTTFREADECMYADKARSHERQR
ncbi:sensor domain-containing diguanylate cyclase [uncultured Senegalimassilia sp.]|uniref:sensor domain-containing diguanylate cyclase n=1 Tax=uncultured Senegalimassilia sp. TaxID=1714350 RepID=UPI0025DE5517|nr:sensor domain-containing diguanylate cyclase [uncultured Senegalimassilia sp.]